MASLHTKGIKGRLRRKIRVRKKVQGTAEKPRLSVFRSAKHIYAQLIDDVGGKTLAAVSTLTKDLGGELAGKKRDKAKVVGSAMARLCNEKKIERVVFDRNGFRFHGRLRAVAEGAREGGLKF